MTHDPLRLAVVIGSNREGRFGDRVGRWFAREARQRPDMVVDLIDLAEIDLPSALPRDPGPPVQGFLARVEAADAFAIVTPEYNRGYPASLKQAIDLAREEWWAKPVGFVSYGGLAGGLRAVEQLRPVFAELHAVTVRSCVSFHMVWDAFDGAGAPRETRGPASAARTMLNQIAWWAAALRQARRERPYGETAA